jgi:hypothetical protein
MGTHKNLVLDPSDRLAVDQSVVSSLFGINNIMVHKSREGEKD